MRLPSSALDLMRGTCAAAALLAAGCNGSPATPPIRPIPAAQLAPVAPPMPPTLPGVVAVALPLPPPPEVVVATVDELDAGVDPAIARRDRARRLARLQHQMDQRRMAACGRG